MHEMSLAEGVLQIIEDYAERETFSRVQTVFLEIGELSSVEVEALKFCFDVVIRDSIAAGARLAIERVAGQGFCLACSVAVPIAALHDACPRCGGYQVQAIAGTEMRVKELQVE